MRDSAGLFELVILMFISATGRRTKQEQGEDQRKENVGGRQCLVCSVTSLYFYSPEN
jgi:hypothetical protein